MKRLQIICLLLAVCCQEVSAQYRVAVIGSSTAGGTGAWPADSAWVRRFNQYYKHQLGIVDSTYTLAVGGYPVYKGMPGSYVPPPDRDGPDHNNNVTKANALLASLPVPANAIVFVNYPSNKYEQYSIGEIMFCLQTIYDSVLREGHRCYIMTTQPRTGGAFDDPAVKRKLAVIKDSTIRRFGAANTINFYDGLYNPADSSILPQYNSGDGIHYNNAGHRELFERVKAKGVFAVPLPVKLSQFTGNYEKGQIALHWAAECTDLNTSFTLQRSGDGRSFESIAQQKTKDLHNNTYDLTDKKPLPGKNFYRLQIRESANTIMSNVILVKNPQDGLQLTALYPIPASQPSLQADLLAMQTYAGSVNVFSATGMSFYRKEISFEKGSSRLNIPVQFLPHGQFILCIRYGDGYSILRSFSK